MTDASMMANQWKVKILSGAYRDAEVILNERQTIGSSEQDADLVIDDAGVQDEHISLTVTSEGVFASALNEGGHITVDGKLWDESLPLPALTQVRSSPITLMIATEDVPWPEASSIETSRMNVQSGRHTPNSQVSAQTSGGGWKVGTISIFGLLITATLLLWMSTGNSGPQLPPLKDRISAFKALVKASSASSLQGEPRRFSHLSIADITKNDSPAELALKGYVETKEDKKFLIDQLSELRIPYTSDLRIMDEVKNAATFVLANLGLEAMSTRSGSLPGSIVFELDARNYDAWGSAENILGRDIPGLTSWELIEVVPNTPMTILEELLAGAGLNQVELSDAGSRIDVYASFTDRQIAAFETVKQQFVAQFGDLPAVVLRAGQRDNTDEFGDFNLLIRGVMLGKVPFIMLTTGEKYMVGSKLPNGARISSIKNDGLLLTKNGKSVMVQLTDRANRVN